MLSSKDVLKGPYIRGQNLERATSSNPELHLVPWTNKSFKLVMPLPKNCGLGGSKRIEFQPLQCKLTNPVK